MRKCDNAVVGDKLTDYKSSVRGCNVIMEQPIARAPQFRSFSLNVLPQTAKNIPVEPGVRGLPFRGKFMMHKPSSDQNHDELAIGCAAAPPLLRYWGSWSLQLRNSCLV